MSRTIFAKRCSRDFEKICRNIEDIFVRKDIFARKSIFVQKDIFVLEDISAQKDISVSEVCYYKKDNIAIDINCASKIEIIEVVFLDYLCLLITTIAIKIATIIFLN